MTSSYLILEDLKLIIDIYNGILTYETFKAHKLKQVYDPEFDPSYNLLSDFINIEVRMSLEDVKAYGEFVKKHTKPIVGNRKAAVVVNSPNQFIYAHKYDESVKDETGQLLFTFTNFDEALNWLQLMPEKERIMKRIELYRQQPMFVWEEDRDIIL